MEIAIILLLILLNGIFSMSEIALISARKTRLEIDARKGNKSSRTALRLAQKPERFLSTVQIGITLIGILTGLYSGAALAGEFGSILVRWGVDPAYAGRIAQIIIVVVVTYLTLIFGELVPKRIGMTAAERTARIVAQPMDVLSKIASPFVWLLSVSTKFFFSVLGINEDANNVTEEEIKAIIQEGTVGGAVQEVEQDIVERVFSLGDRDVASIMTHRSDMTMLNLAMNPDQISAAVKADPFALYPVTDKNDDDVVGVVYLKDLFGEVQRPGFVLKDYITPANYFHETQSVYMALEYMRDHRVKYGLVTDEFGDIQGIVTLKDVLEGLLGSLPAVGDAPDILEREDGTWLVDGQCSFYDFLAHYDREELYAEHDYNTLSGLILSQLNHVPHEGEKLHWAGFDFEVVDMDGARIDKVLVSRGVPESTDEGD